MGTAAEANRRYFREAYRSGQHGWAVEGPSPFVARYLDRLRRRVPGGSLLDIGCGEGRHTIAAAQRGFAATGIDYEPLALRRARQQADHTGLSGLQFRRADVFAMPFAQEAFDIVLDFGCLHHQRKADWPRYRPVWTSYDRCDLHRSLLGQMHD